jgi:hypothetical protein
VCGESGTFTDADGTWTVRGLGNLSTVGLFRGIRFTFDQDDPPPGVDPGWTLEFMNAESAELEVGHYTNLGRDTDPLTPSMKVSNDITCSGDDDPENSFTVTEIEYDLGTAAKAGTYGLEVSLGATCTSPDAAVITSSPTITGTVEGCNSLTVSGAEVVPPGATLRAGTVARLGELFSVASDADVTVGLDPALFDGFPFVEDDTPTAEKTYEARFDLNLDDATLDDADSFKLLVAYSSVGQEVFRLRVKRNAGENRLVSSVRRDDGSFAETPEGEERLLPAGWNTVHMEWKTGVDSGELLISINDSVFVGLTGVDNDTLAVDRMRWGVVGGPVASSSGSVKLDNFNSWK